MELNEKNKEYLTQFDLGDRSKSRIDEALSLSNRIKPLGEGEIFISEYREKESGNRILENFWIFSDEGVFESKQFTNRGNLDFVSLSGISRSGISRHEFSWESYDFEQATEKSILQLYISVSQLRMNLELKASGLNCDKLFEVFNKFLIKHI